MIFAFKFFVLQKYLAESGICGNCTSWRIRTSETWGVEYESKNRNKPHSIPVGLWRPVNGLTMNDALFIHISHGFRGKTLPVVSFHVRYLHNAFKD